MSTEKPSEAKKPSQKASLKTEKIMVACTVNQPPKGKIGVSIGNMIVAPGKKLKLPADEVKQLVELGVVTAG